MFTWMLEKSRSIYIRTPDLWGGWPINANPWELLNTLPHTYLIEDSGLSIAGVCKGNLCQGVLRKYIGCFENFVFFVDHFGKMDP